MRKLFSEPLIHFLALGVLIFVLYGWLNRDVPGEEEIVVTRGQQEHLINIFARTWQRPPTEAEFQGLLQDYIREEIAYREGVAMGLDEGDTVIRRRMRQKLELLTDEIVSVSEPGDEALAAFLRDNLEKFRIEARFDLRHIYLSPERRGASARTDAREMLAQLQAEPDAEWAAMGDPLTLGDEFRGVRPSDLQRQFGSQFGQQVLNVPAGSWQGPIESGFGLHLVYVDNFVPARDPPLDEVRQQVRTEWFAQRRLSATYELYERLAERYIIEIEPLGDRLDS